MLYLYCPKKSQGAFELVKGLNAHRLRMFDGIDFWDKRKRYELKEGDIVVCWGDNIPEVDGIRVLNALDAPRTALEKWSKLVNTGVSTIALTRTKPTTSSPLTEMAVALEATQPTYYIQQESFTAEYRIHSFGRRSIGAGVKIPRPGFAVCTEALWRPDANLIHPRVRMYDTGWQTNYEFQSTPELRKLAHKAVTALGLTFGAVDIGMSNGRLKVIDVNMFPKIEGKTVASYIRAITRWITEAVPVSPLDSAVNVPEEPYVAGGIRVGAPEVPEPEIPEPIAPAGANASIDFRANAPIFNVERIQFRNIARNIRPYYEEREGPDGPF